ncbi:MAG: macro domain-containing protein [Candidatus Hermodarchaeota archaeon]
MREIIVKNSKIKLVQGDITELDTEVIVNAANTQLILGGGVAGAIRRKGGPTIQEACNKIGGTFVGGAVITTGGNLKAKHVIHAVGPRMGEKDEDTKLRNAVINSLKLMDQNGLKTIAFPAISTGIFGYPIERCSKVMISTVKEYLSGDTQIEEVIFCLFSNPDYEVFNSDLY